MLLDPNISKRVVDAAVRRANSKSLLAVTRSNALSKREMQILTLVRQGLNNEHIARRLSISSQTVKAHMGNIMKKLHVTNRTEAAVKAMHLDTNNVP